jgi:hypothetical protein
MKTRTLIGAFAAVSAMTLAASAGVVVDDFNGATLNPMWTLSDAPGNYGSGGGFAVVGGKATFQNIDGGAYGNIRTSLGTVGASDTVRVDANMRQDDWNNGRWTQGVTLYFDANNWIELREAASNGDQGWSRQGMVNGGNYWDQDVHSTTQGEMRWTYVIGGVELTPTQILFYGSPVAVDNTGVSADDIDTHVGVISEFTMARPASFTGPAYAIIGKVSAFGSNTNNVTGTFANNYIDWARITTPEVPEPASLGLMALGSLVMLRRSRRRG